MSYNIDTFKLKELKEFKLPVDSLYRSDRADWHPDMINLDDGSVSFKSGDSFLKGILKDGLLYVNEFECSGEGSGNFLNEILKQAFKESSGYLEAICIWARGDAISRLIVKDGIVKEEDVDL